jgi:hypothetical protein
LVDLLALGLAAAFVSLATDLERAGLLEAPLEEGVLDLPLLTTSPIIVSGRRLDGLRTKEEGCAAVVGCLARKVIESASKKRVALDLMHCG